jgi:hypothetical protein
VLVAVGGVLDQVLLGELEALGLASSGLIHGSALLVVALLAATLGEGIGRRRVVHALTVLPP